MNIREESNPLSKKILSKKLDAGAIYADLSKELGMSAVFISEIARGEKVPTWYHSDRFAKVFGESPEYWDDLILKTRIELLERQMRKEIKERKKGVRKL